MKDKRLDILLEHFLQIKECQHYLIEKSPSQLDHLQMGFCFRMMKEGMPKTVDCSGRIKACEL